MGDLRLNQNNRTTAVANRQNTQAQQKTTSKGLDLKINKVTIEKGQGYYTALQELTGGGVIPNHVTIKSLIRYNHGLGVSQMKKLQPGDTLKFPQTPDRIKQLGKLGFKFTAYCVQKGESPNKIAEHLTGNKENYQAIMKINNIESVYDLQAGQIIYVPHVTNLSWGTRLDILNIETHTVKSGDSVSGIAEKYTGNYANADIIRQLNNKTGNSLKIGEKLIVPDISNNLESLKLHLVQPGENFTTIVKDRAQELGIKDSAELKNYARLTQEQSFIANTNTISPNQLIIFPSTNSVTSYDGVKPEINTDLIEKKTTPDVVGNKTTTVKKTSAVTTRKSSRVIKPTTFTKGVTTDNKFWKLMRSTIKADCPGKADLLSNNKKLSLVFDMANLLVKEVDEGKNAEYEMQLVALTVMNRMTVSKAQKDYRLNSDKPNRKLGFETMWGDATLKGIVLHPFQYSSFNRESDLNVSTLDQYGMESKWEKAVRAAVKIMSGDLSGIDKKYQNYTMYYNPKLCSPDWANEKIEFKGDKVKRFVRIANDKVDHYFFRADNRLLSNRILQKNTLVKLL